MRHIATHRSWILAGILIALAAVPLMRAGHGSARAVPRTARPTPVARVARPLPAARAAVHRTPSAPVTSRATEAGMKAYLDPETGTFGAPPIGAAPGAAAAVAEPTPVQIVRPDGSVILDLQGGGQDYLVLQLDASGRRITRCVADPRSPSLPPAPAPQREER